jgi:non-homologous end joining protein Ku
MARAIWKGVIRFGDAEVPVKLYSAVEDRGVHFRLLHEKTGRPVKQRMVNPVTGDEVDHDDIRRGYEVESGVFVLLEDEDLESVQPEKSRDIAITRFLDPSVINHPWYDRPYHLGPDGDAEGYYGLVAALSGEFDPEDYRDEYRDRVLELVEAKAEGTTVKFPEPKKREETDDLAGSLQASLKAAKERKSA